VQVWSLPYVNVARSYLRRAGLTRLIAAPARARNRLRRVWYDMSRPASVDARVDGASVKMLVADATEFVRVMSYREDRAIISALLATLVPGDVYWDIGASVGLYTTLMARGVGPAGQVVAYEPEPRSNARLRENVSRNGLDNVRVFDLALGRAADTMHLHFAGHFTAGTHTLYATTATAPSSGTVPVRVVRGDDLRVAEQLRTPNTIKIDVEGAEEDVIAGLASTLAEPACRAVLCEVHFALLEARGHRDAPARIVHTLGSLGFRKTRWIDPSHLIAVK
jgi:FkbM family methyltransferase